MIKRPVYLFSMDSEQFHAAPLTTGGLQAYYQAYGAHPDELQFELVHYRDASDIQSWRESSLPKLINDVKDAENAGYQAVFGFSFYTWNAAEFLQLIALLRPLCANALIIAGGPHVQEADTYLLQDPIDLVVLGEGEQTFVEVIDASFSMLPESPTGVDWAAINGLAWLEQGTVKRSAERAREKQLDRLPSALDIVPLNDSAGNPIYDSISYETSRGCPFKCAFCEWGTGAIGSKMIQFSMERVRSDWRKVVDAGIENIWLADSNFGALREDLAKTELICELKRETGLPRTFATSWSKKHSPRVQEIVLMLHRNALLPHYQLALQTLTPLALELSNRKNMAANKYEPIAREMAQAGVPIAAELIWGLPGDNLADFEANLDQLLAGFPNINIFAYTLLPGTEFYQRRDEYEIEAVPVAGYGKAKGEYVVASHTFDRAEGLDGYFLITAHTILIHGHMLPLAIRFMAMQSDFPATPLLRTLLAALCDEYAVSIDDKLDIYERRAELYLRFMNERERSFNRIRTVISQWCEQHSASVELAQQIQCVLELDEAICPRTGPSYECSLAFDFSAAEVLNNLEVLELPGAALFEAAEQTLKFHHPGGVGDVLKDPDGGSWMKAHWQKAAHGSLALELLTELDGAGDPLSS